MHSKKHCEEKRQLAHKASDTLDFERLMQANEDVEIYDSDMDDEVDWLEIAIEWEKNSQVRWKVAHRKATEKWDKQTFIPGQGGVSIWCTPLATQPYHRVTPLAFQFWLTPYLDF